MSNSDPWSECLQTMHPEEKITYIYTYISICTFIYRPCYVAYGTLDPPGQALNLGPLVAQTVKNLPVTWEIWVRFLGQEDTLEKGIATHSSILFFLIFFKFKLKFL